MPEPVVDRCEPEPAFATLEVDSGTIPGLMGSASIEARGAAVCLEGDIGATLIAEIALAYSAAAMSTDTVAITSVAAIEDRGR